MASLCSHESFGNGPQAAVLVIQYNWPENIRKNESNWVYYKKLNEKSIDGHSGDGIFNVFSMTGRAITICYVPTNERTKFISPFKTFNRIHEKSIMCLDTADGGLGVTVSLDNKLYIWQTDDGIVRRQLEGHVFDVYTCHFFPSGIVVLSAGADMQIKVWDAVTGQCPVTLKGHTAPITDTCIVEKGRNIISVSKDGTSRLWNCAESKCVATLLETESEINCCDITDVQNHIEIPPSNQIDPSYGDLEYCTERKLLALGCEDGKIYLVFVASKEILITHFLSSAILSVCWLPSLVVIIGVADGRIMKLDAKNPSHLPQLLAHDSASAVLCMTPVADGVVVGRRDGICQYYAVDCSGSVIQFTGPNCDPIYSVSKDKEYIYTACRDSIIRKYKIADMQIDP